MGRTPSLDDGRPLRFFGDAFLEFHCAITPLQVVLFLLRQEVLPFGQCLLLAPLMSALYFGPPDVVSERPIIYLFQFGHLSPSAYPPEPPSLLSWSVRTEQRPRRAFAPRIRGGVNFSDSLDT